MKYLPFLDVTQHRLVVSYRRFGTTYRSHFPGSSCLTLQYLPLSSTQKCNILSLRFSYYSHKSLSLSLSLSTVALRSTQIQFPDVSIPICFSPASNIDFFRSLSNRPSITLLTFQRSVFLLWYSYTLPSQFLLLTFFPHALVIAIFLFSFLRWWWWW